MSNFFKASLLFFTGIAIIIAGFYIGYNLESIKKPNTQINSLQSNDNEPAANVIEPKINEATKMIYEYYYKDDNKIDVIEDIAPYFLIDKNKKEVEKNFSDWQIRNFSSKEVVLRKYIENKNNQKYVIGEYNGLITVFYEKEKDGNSIKDITNIPLSSLNEEEQQKLRNGIEINGDDELIKVMESYES